MPEYANWIVKCEGCGRPLTDKVECSHPKKVQSVYERRARIEHPLVTAGHIKGRPYCHWCLEPGRPLPRPYANLTYRQRVKLHS